MYFVCSGMYLFSRNSVMMYFSSFQTAQIHQSPSRCPFQRTRSIFWCTGTCRSPAFAIQPSSSAKSPTFRSPTSTEPSYHRGKLAKALVPLLSAFHICTTAVTVEPLHCQNVLPEHQICFDHKHRNPSILFSRLGLLRFNGVFFVSQVNSKAKLNSP